jgi:hypothetical protein
MPDSSEMPGKGKKGLRNASARRGTLSQNGYGDIIKHAGFLRDARKREKRLAERISQKRYLEPKWLR